MLKRWLKQPTTDRASIQQRLDIVDFLILNESCRQDLQNNYLRQFPDIQKLYSKFYRVQAGVKHSANLLDCVKVYNLIQTLTGMCDYLSENVNDMDESHESIREVVLTPLKDTLDDFKVLSDMLEKSIDVSAAK